MKRHPNPHCTSPISRRPPGLALALLLVALAFLALAPAALAFQTRTPLDFFGPAGPGPCPGTTLSGSHFAVGSGDLTAATGTGDTTILATGNGNTTAGSTTITNVTTTSGSFTVGAPIAGNGNGIPNGTTITAVGADTLTLSQPVLAGFGGNSNLTSGSPTIANVANAASFSVGWTIAGNGIPNGTTITAVGADTLTLSTGVTQTRTASDFTAGSTQLTNVNTSCGAFAVGQTIAGAGIPDGPPTKITAVGAGTLTLSAGATAAGSGVGLTASPAFGAALNLAFDQASDVLYALDDPDGPMLGARQPTLDAFDAATLTPTVGAFPLSVSNTQTNGPPIAVDQTSTASAGNVYYNNGEDLYGYDSTGAPLGGNFPIDNPPAPGKRCGGAVDSAGNIWLAYASSSGSALQRYDSAGNPIGDIAISQGEPCGLAFDSNDDLYLAVSSPTPGKSGVYRFSAASNYATAVQITSGSTGAIALDRATHTLYAVQNFRIRAYDLSGTQLYEFGIAGGDTRALAVDESTGRVYVAGGSRIRVYGALADFPDATATPGSATNVTTTTTDLSATIDDNSALPTRWRFQLSKDDGATWTGANGNRVNGVTGGGQSGLVVSGTAVDLQSGTDYQFRVVTDKGGGSTDVASATADFQTVALPPASATCDQPAANVTATGADLACTLDDQNSFPTNWRFQLSTDDGATWADTKVAGKTAGSQSGVAVAGTVTGLDPNTPYRFRLATSKGAGAVDTDFDGPAPFTTLLAPPVVANVGSYAVTDTSAYLAGEVDPRHAQTSYVFAYGTSPGALDSTTPAADVGSGLGAVVVAQPLPDLAPDTDYYFKLAATNSAGTTESGVFSLHTRAQPLPDPDHRAYEMVTPPDKNYGDAGLLGATTVARGGQAISYGMFANFGQPPGQVRFLSTNYVSRRGPDGWRTRFPGEPECTDPADQAVVDTFSLNFDRAFVVHDEPAGCPLPPLDPAAPLDGDNLYLGDYSADPPAYRLLTPQPGSVNISSGGLAGNDDFSLVVFGNKGQQTLDAPAAGFTKLFSWEQQGHGSCVIAGGCFSLLSRDTAGAPFATDSSVVLQGPNVVSATGDRVFFSNPAGGQSKEIYMRQGGATTYDVSQSECTSSCGSDAPDSFRGATPAGNKALIMSAAKLTNDDSSTSGQDLYLYTHSSNPPAQKNLTLLSKDSEPADGTTADVQGVVGMGDDGDTVFFLANGQLVAGAPTTAGAKLYRWRRNGGSPTLDYLATFATTPLNGASGITSSGSYLFLYTSTRLDPGTDHDADRDVYRWSAGDGWLCLSCQLPGVPSAGNSPTLTDGDRGLAFADDGQRAFFTSSDSLVPGDANNGIADVYEWHDGRLSLISTGLGTKNVGLLGAGSSGDDVFFATHERLVGWDTDQNSDIYDARVGGGFPEPLPDPVPCDLNAGACEGAPTVDPGGPGPGTPGFQGPGNPAPVHPKAKRHKTHEHRKHHKRHRRANHNRRAAR